MSKLSTLFVRISLVFFIILLSMGLATLWVSNRNSKAYFLEFTQQLNAPIAMYMAENANLVKNDQLDQQSLEALAAHVMVINPSLEVYLLDNDGEVLMSEAQAALYRQSGKLFNPRVNMEPIQEFLKPDRVFPIVGSNPLDPVRDNIFSAFPLYSNSDASTEKQKLGYVYAVLASQSHQSLINTISESYSFKNLVLLLAGTLVIALTIGVGLFFLITKRLRALIQRVSDWQIGSLSRSVPIDNSFSGTRLCSSPRVMEGATTVKYEKRGIEKKPGKFPLNIIRNDEIDVLSSTYDFMADQLISKNQSLQEHDKNRRMFFATISHDLRTPLTTMESYLETLLLKNHSINAEDRFSYLNTAHKQCIRLRRLVIQLFEFSKLTSGGVSLEFEEFSLLELCNDCIQQFALDAQKEDIFITMRPNEGFDDVLNVNADIGLIQRVLENLIGNAVKYTPAGGNIVITLKKLGEKRVYLAVCNSGEGMAPTTISNLFKSYYPQINASCNGHGSTGLGLYIVKSIVELHGSKLHIDSVKNVGTLCSFELKAA